LQPSAQWEIREVAEKMLAILKIHAPHVFEDL
jgi:thymidylate synthase ThyX